MRILSSIFVAFLFVSCLNDKNQPSPTTTGNDGNGGTTTIPITPTTVTCSPDTVYFQQTILPLITSNCAMSGCHDAISHKDGVILTDYAHIRAYSSATNPTGSTLYKSVVNGYMPPKAPWSATQKATLLKWMQQGAKNNSCVASSANCDTVNVTYSATVAPVLKTYCVGCHSAASPSAGIDLSTYAVVKVQAANGRLIGSITHAVGYKPMPSATSKLGSCEISQIQAWVTKGMLNN
jgi:mono/diheme cytochrome c family protein